MFYLSDNSIFNSHSIEFGLHEANHIFTVFLFFIHRLKKKKQAKQNAEIISATATKSNSGKEDANSVILEQDKSNIAVEGEYNTDEKKKRKNNQLKEIRRTELKRYYSIGEYP